MGYLKEYKIKFYQCDFFCKLKFLEFGNIKSYIMFEIPKDGF